VTLECNDLDNALAFFTGELDFRIETIFPADAPRVATLSADGIHATLRKLDGDAEAVTAPALIVTKPDERRFSPGRAGMQYRDLIPGRFGGRFIASHIRIPDGGPVPDYVHHHDIEFQLIFCVNGWVRVAYEDQGEPMVMRAGDCFLQPPHIRHRVLECSDAMEVVEITCPAEHETAVDHALTLPTGSVDTDRTFGGQRFVFFRSAATDWRREDDGSEVKDTGIAAATDGIVSAELVRVRGEADLSHDGELIFLYALAGNATLQASDDYAISRDVAIAIPPDTNAMLRKLSDDFEALRVSVPSPSSGR
ncbi:MAG: cupin domain-containing protein, partial [Woeseiaceae bacterium]|nr:cupin domain-containing protein [Woeseiaceae bacterium]